MKRKTRDLSKTREEILQVAFFEIFKKGFQGVSIDEIVAKTPYTKGALYHQFPTKNDLGYAVVEEVIQPMIISRWITPLQGFENPIEGILHQIESLIGNAKIKDLTLGCPLNNLTQEMCAVDDGFKDRLRNALELWINGLKVNLIRGQRNGFVKKSIDPEEAAHFIVMTHEGFYGTIKCLSSRKTYKSLLNSLKLYIKTLEV